MHPSEVRTSRLGKRTLCWAATILTLATLSACGSSDSDATPTKASGSATGASNSAVTEAVTAATTRPDKIPVTEPIGKPIPADKTVYYINCGPEGCAIFGRVVAQAGAQLGWKVKELATDGSPGQIANAWQTAIRAKPYAIVHVGVPLAQVANYMKEAAGAGIKVVAIAVPQETAPNVLWIGLNKQQSASSAHGLAAFVAGQAASSGLTDAEVLFVNVPDFQSVNQAHLTFDEDMPKLCPKCKVDTLNIGLANFPQAPAQIVSYLRAHPDVRYVAYGADNFSAATDQIAAAGLDVKVVTTTPTPSTMTQLAKGSLDAVVSFPYYEIGYAAVDALAREAAGVPVLPLPSVPTWLVTKDTAPTGQFPYPVVADAVEQYKALWNVA